MSSPSAPPRRPDRAIAPVVQPGVVQAMRAAGLDLEALARACGLPRPERLRAALPELSRHEADRLLDVAFAEHPPIALTLGSRVDPALMGLIGLVMLTAPDYGSALGRCARYKQLDSDLRVAITHELRRILVEVESSGPTGPARQGRVEAKLAFFVGLGRTHVAGDVNPTRVELRRRRPASATAFESFFLCPVIFDADRDALHLSPACITHPLLSAAPEVHALLSTTADRRLDQGGDDLIHRTRRAVESLLADGAPSVERVAERLGTSPRTLQRRLRETGTRLSDVVDTTRYELARHHLRGHRFSLDDIAFLLGFAGVGSFTRAFRRWSGVTPGAYRTASRRDASSQIPAAPSHGGSDRGMA